MNRPAVTQAAVARAIKAAESLGKSVAGVRLRPDRTVDVIFGEPQALTPPPPTPLAANLEEELEAFAAKHGYG